MSERLQRVLNNLRQSKTKALSVFTMAGYPTPEATLEIVPLLARAGVDFVELGIPFSDPIADGPIIQAAAHRALQHGTTLHRVLQMIEQLRRQTDIPLLLMGYVNPVWQFGLEPFAETCRRLQVDGIILPDLPLEEYRPYQSLFQATDLDVIHLIAPNTPEHRIRTIDRHSTAFIYCTTHTGVTGRNPRSSARMTAFFSQLSNWVTHPVMIGFGVKSHRDFVYYSQFADGVIVGSAFLQFLQSLKPDDYPSAIPRFVRAIRHADPEGMEPKTPR